MSEAPSGWNIQRLTRGEGWHRRFVFGSYRETRAFLDGLASLAEELGYHPQNVNFATNYVNVTLEVGEEEREREQAAQFAQRLGALAVMAAERRGEG
ncbi:MAG: 4a-hydroxytetrahydrobiopterin dehydratase [Hydrogenophilus sp.]|nr:4a-hydroxytetrahydrobiopterin dehydratase [Hydrogenophilus sp.]